MSFASLVVLSRCADWSPCRSANACYKEAAEIAATLGQYPRAIEHFEKVAQQSLGSALTRYGVKEHYLKAGMCWLATGVRSPFPQEASPADSPSKQDVVSTKRAIDNYTSADPSFATTRECQFLNGITEAFDAGDAEGFTAHVAEFDRCAHSFPLSHRARADSSRRPSLTRLDNWKTSLLLTIKRGIAEEPSLT